MQLHEYQETAVDFILKNPYCGLFLDMGLGKTLITLTALSRMKMTNHVLIIAPKNIARSTWLDEIKKWNFDFRTKSFLVDENGKDLKPNVRHTMYKNVLNEPPTIYFINREKITDLTEYAPVLNNKKVWCFPTVVIDESQSFKSYNSERFKALKTVRPCISRLIELTGTPIPNGLMDIWSQIYLLDQGQRLCKNITGYRNKFFRPTLYVQNHPVKWEPLPGAEDWIYKSISDITISMKNTNLNLPPVTYNNITVHLSSSEMNVYKKMLKTSVLKFDDDTVISAANAAVLQAKLSQMASGALYTNPETKEYKKIHSRKVEQCEYIINNTDSPVMIAYHFQSDKDMILKYFAKNKEINPIVFDGTPEMLKAWNRREIKVLLIQPASAGHGLNFQEGGHTLIWYTIPWSLEHYQQTNARLYRQGQKEPVIIHHLSTEHTVDQKIAESLMQKDFTQEKLLDAVKIALKGVK